MRLRFAALLWVVLLLGSSISFAAGPAATNPAQADADFAFQGEYVGEVDGAEGLESWGVQIVALGDGKFQLVGYPGGLPGAGWNEQEKRQAEGVRSGNVVTFSTDEFTATIQDSTFRVQDSGGQERGTLEKITRKSPTEGAKPPQGAVVLFDGSTADHFDGGRLTAEGLLMEGVTSKQKFQDFSIHIEFILPYMPAARGQARGNSGFYMQGRYEVQMLDSFGLKGENNECGGLYTVAAPRINMCYPPLSWQTYDIDFTAARYDASGKKTQNARATVRHNGVLIHDNVEIPHATRANPLAEGSEPGPVYLQNHGNPVRYRNIWLVDKQ